MTTALKLYGHVDAYQVVLDWMEEYEDEIIAAGGVLPPELEGLLEGVQGDLQAKVERTALVVQNLLANAKAAKGEADRLAGLARSYERQADTLKSYLKRQLERAGVKKVETPTAKVAIQKNGRPSLRLADPNYIPEQFKVQPPPPPPVFDSQGAYEYLKGAKLLPTEPGVIELDGIVIELGSHLRIR